MRCFEILTLIGLLFTLIVLLFTKVTRPTGIFCSILLSAALVLHLAFEGARWQMVPIYLYAAILLLITLKISIFQTGQRNAESSSGLRKVIRVSGISLALLLLLLFAIPPSLLPVFKIPPPTGPYMVGTTTMHYSDSSRLDLHAESAKFREFSVRVWYPASVKGDEETLPYMKAIEARSLAELYHMPSFFLGHFNSVKTDSYLNAAPRAGNYPVLFYSPSGDMLQNTALFQELASHGYIVFSVGHPYWNAFCYDSIGRVIPFDNANAYYSSMWDEESSDSVTAIKERITIATNFEQKRMEHRKLNQYMPMEIADIRLWAGDLSFLLDELENPGENHPEWMDYMETDLAGVMGFSKGGSAAGQFCVTEPRCRAGVNLSGFMFGDAVEHGISVPFMFMENIEEWCLDCNPICEILYKEAKNDAYMIRIKGARHGNFSDWSLVGGYLKIMGMTGPIKGKRCLEIQARYVCSFFDRYLKEEEAPLLDGPSEEYPEVEFASRN
jgi:predicted dienelactone hydrolase